MEKRRWKTGSNVMVTCPLCGKVLTKAGLIGHMHWKHDRDYKAPMLSKGMLSYGEAMRKARLYDKVKLFEYFTESFLDLLLSKGGATPENLRLANALIAKSEETALNEPNPKRVFEIVAREGKLILTKEGKPFVEIKPINSGEASG